MGTIRAGGHVLCESGWEPESLPLPTPPKVFGKPAGLTETEQEADRQAAAARAAMEPGERRDRAECPDCGRELPVNKNGSLRKHTCVIDAPPPQVTFDGEE